MRFTRSAAILGIVGVLLLAGAVVVRFAVLPSVSKLPTDLNTTQAYSGSYAGLNPAALSGGSGPVLLGGVPMTASRTYTSVSVSGNTEVVRETIPSSLAGQAQPTATTDYAVDRTTMESVPPPSGAKGVVQSSGLVFTLPLHPDSTASYRLWDPTTAKAYPLTYVRTTTVQGRQVYEYRSQANGPVADPASLGLPASMSKGALLALAPRLAGVIPAQLLDQLQAVAAQLPDTIPITYTSQNTATVRADTTTGAPLFSGKDQTITAQLRLGIPVSVPFSTVKLQTTARSAERLAGDADTSAAKLDLIGLWTPIALGIVGLGLLVWALVLARRNATRPGGPAPVAGSETTTPVPV